MSERHKIEIKLYELLGVKIFKKLVFKLEKIIHRKDNGKNINYHIKNCNSKESVDSFRKYLYYNGFIHIKNIIALIITILSVFIFNTYPMLICLLFILLVKDAYCVMLQRYNWIKLNDFERKLEIREQKQITRKYNDIDRELLFKSIKNEKIDKKEIVDELKKIKNYLLNIENDDYVLNDNIIKISDISKNDIKRKIKKRGKDDEKR